MPTRAKLNVPWDKIREAVEKGTPQTEIAALYGIKKDTIRARSQREGWSTPRRLGQALSKVSERHNDKVAGLHDNRVARNLSLIDQLNESEAGQKSPATATDLEAISKEYRHKAADKLYKILTQTIIAPPRTWKDFDIADKMMRRTLGLDDGEAKSNTIVQLQVVNDRLRSTLQDDIIEGESVTEVSPIPTLQSPDTGCQPVTTSDPADDGQDGYDTACAPQQ
jgi:hypothetical protein